MNVQQFIEEEVERQGFPRGKPIWRERCTWMAMAWGWAMAMQIERALPSKDNVEALGSMVEREANMNGFRQCDIYVGGRKGAPPSEIPRLMKAWALALPGLTADEAYYEFELIHPFEDGNGRTGKIIHNWMLGRLWDPVLVKDFFGCGNP